jgi:hypothetical protein
MGRLSLYSWECKSCTTRILDCEDLQFLTAFAEAHEAGHQPRGG